MHVENAADAHRVGLGVGTGVDDHLITVQRHIVQRPLKSARGLARGAGPGVDARGRRGHEALYRKGGGAHHKEK